MSATQSAVHTASPQRLNGIGHVTDAPLMILRAEGAILLAAASAAHALQDATWWLFAALAITRRGQLRDQGANEGIELLEIATAGDTVELKGNSRAANGSCFADQTSFRGCKIA